MSNSEKLQHPQYADERFSTLVSIKTPRLTVVVGWMMMFLIGGAASFLAFTPWIQTTYGSGSVTALNPNGPAAGN